MLEKPNFDKAPFEQEWHNPNYTAAAAVQAEDDLPIHLNRVKKCKN
jgi:hypothetical protein